MATHRKHLQKETFYFITFTCHKWIPLLRISKLGDYFEIWLKRLNEKGLLVSAYVMMPNHIHLLLFFSDSCKDLNKTIGNAKRFMAYEIVKRLNESSKTGLLKKLHLEVKHREREIGKKHQVFIISFDANPINDHEALNRVVNYIHFNPVSGKWSLVDDYAQYPLSSAGYYVLGKENELIGCDFRS